MAPGGPRRRRSALKHKMFSYSYNGNPETHGSMSYVVFIDQILKSLTSEPAQIPNDDEDKKTVARFAQPPPARAERSSPALIPSTSPALILTLTHAHLLQSISRLGAMTKAFTPPNSNYYYYYYYYYYY